MVQMCPFVQKGWVEASTISCFYCRLIVFVHLTCFLFTFKPGLSVTNMKHTQRPALNKDIWQLNDKSGIRTCPKLKQGNMEHKAPFNTIEYHCHPKPITGLSALDRGKFWNQPWNHVCLVFDSVQLISTGPDPVLYWLMSTGIDSYLWLTLVVACILLWVTSCSINRGHLCPI